MFKSFKLEILSIKTTISYDVNAIDWNKQLLKNMNSTTYQTYEWAKLYEKVYDSIPLYIISEDTHGNILGQLTAVIHSKYFWTKTGKITELLGTKLNLQSFIYWFYGPVIFDETLTEEIVDSMLIEVDKIAIKHNVSMIRGNITPHTVNQLKPIFYKKGYSCVDWSTYVISLPQHENTLYDSLNKTTRYDIRKTENNDLKFFIADSREDLDEYLELKYTALEKNGQKSGKGNTNLIKKFNDAHWEILQKENLEKLFLVKYEGELLGGVRCFTFNNNFYQQNVANSDKKGFLGGTFLTWNSIKWAINNNKYSFDMGGANPNPSSSKEKQIDFYKSKWGGKKLHYCMYTKILDKTKFRFATLLKNPRKIIQKINFE